MFVNYLMVAIGAMFGVLARVLLSNWIKKNGPIRFPWPHLLSIFQVSWCLVL